MKTKLLLVDSIRIDGGTQQREEINVETLELYSAALKEGAKFPPIVVFHDGVQNWLADGFHRLHAHRSANLTEIMCEIHDGTVRGAILFSVGSNSAHGLRPTNADKRKAALTLLQDKEWSHWTDHKIAAHCHVTQPFVSKLRKEILTPSKPITVIKTPPKAAPVADVANPENPEKPAFDPKEYALSEALNSAQAFADENAVLREAIAANQMPAGIEIEPAADIIAALRKELDTLGKVHAAVVHTRDTLMHENAQLRQQDKRNQTKIAKLTDMLKKAGIIKK